MSISDQIVVMQSGKMQQIGRPQAVYDVPENLFVAKFLGTPPINVFFGRIEKERLFIGEDEILFTPGIADQEVYVGVRPEGFLLDEQGPLHCNFEKLDVMGRDWSVLASHPALEGERMRAMLSGEETIDPSRQKVHFSLKKGKVYLFNRDTEKRIDWNAAEGGMGK